MAGQAEAHTLPVMIESDIVIAGGGLAGMIAAARLSADSWRVALVDAAPAGTASRDRRTTALFQPAIETMAKAGVIDPAAPPGTPLATMRLVDAGGRERAPRTTADFLATEAGHDIFGWNFENAPLGDVLRERLAERPGVTVLAGAKVTGRLARTEHTILRLDDGRQIRAKLAIAADGRDSTLRRLAGIRHRRWAYGQHALVFHVTMGRPHDNVSTEIHRTGGPLTLVPLDDIDGEPAGSIVWMMPAAEAEAHAAMTDADLSTALTAATMGLFGPMTVAGPRGVFPIISQIAMAVRAPRLALVAEAAHVMPPIGAQGLNTSLFDVETLAGLIAGADDPGAPALLDRFQARTLPHAMMRVGGIDILNRAAQAEPLPLRDLRNLGLRALHGIGPLRRLAIRTGMNV